MAALLLFAILFICGLINSYFFLHRPKLLAWLASFLCMTSTPKPIAKIPKKDGKEVVASKVVADRAGIETVFATFDRDGDGFVTAEELEESFKRLGFVSTRNEIVSMMERVDANEDGLIDLEEFGELYDSLGRGRGGGGGGDGDERVERGKEEEEEGEMELREAFDVFDENGDGLITVEELGLVLASLGLKRGVTAEDCRDMIRKVDLDGDGMVNFGEFKKMMVEGGKLF
ncbi:calmodulin-like protein 6 [Cocos nucifera]|uniref:Calmodulin-like protein 6 n=1 Tax=Cocos nucifera TaxID=13894 RepID=A0A8K0IMU1_COCNU|nr:calmodulin-like protein 6 [Cocos nucifera]